MEQIILLQSVSLFQTAGVHRAIFPTGFSAFQRFPTYISHYKSQWNRSLDSYAIFTKIPINSSPPHLEFIYYTCIDKFVAQHLDNYPVLHILEESHTFPILFVRQYFQHDIFHKYLIF